MYSSSDFERLFIRYKAEAMPEGESIRKRPLLPNVGWKIGFIFVH